MYSGKVRVTGGYRADRAGTTQSGQRGRSRNGVQGWGERRAVGRETARRKAGVEEVQHMIG